MLPANEPTPRCSEPDGTDTVRGVIPAAPKQIKSANGDIRHDARDRIAFFIGDPA
jgi:hypothetical protein